MWVAGRIAMPIKYNADRPGKDEELLSSNSCAERGPTAWSWKECWSPGGTRCRYGSGHLENLAACESLVRGPGTNERVAGHESKDLRTSGEKGLWSYFVIVVCSTEGNLEADAPHEALPWKEK